MALFGSSGYRALVDRQFMQTAFGFGFAIGSTARTALVATDTRTSADAVKYCVISGLLASGCKAYDGGIMPTPTLAFNCRDFDTGVMITASHNPPQYNGIKPWNPDGSAYDSPQRNRIESLISRSTAPTASWEDMQPLSPFVGGIDRHIERILKDMPGTVKLKAVVDCGGGAGSTITPSLLGKMGCEVVPLNCTATGLFPRNSEPTEGNLAGLATLVRESGADFGIAHDADADRLVVCDERGEFILGDKLLVMLARRIHAGTIVTTVDASMSVEEQGFSSVTRTKVGDAYVSDELKKRGEFGGEPCGAWVFPKVSYCPDAIYAAAVVATIASEERLSHHADALPSYPILRGSARGASSLMASIEAELKLLSPISIDATDGFRAAFPDGWLLVRPSGTEPKIRVTAEARTSDKVDSLYNSAIKIISDLSANSKETN